MSKHKGHRFGPSKMVGDTRCYAIVVEKVPYKSPKHWYVSFRYHDRRNEIHLFKKRDLAIDFALLNARSADEMIDVGWFPADSNPRETVSKTKEIIDHRGERFARGQKVKVLPGYSCETKTRTIHDGWAGQVLYVIKEEKNADLLLSSVDPSLYDHEKEAEVWLHRDRCELV